NIQEGQKRWKRVPNEVFKAAETADKKLFDMISDIKVKAKETYDQLRDESAWLADVVQPIPGWEMLNTAGGRSHPAFSRLEPM
ncbi:MAG: hypothetical protein Q9163_004541, partial [Psora crenata]